MYLLFNAYQILFILKSCSRGAQNFWNLLTVNSANSQCNDKYREKMSTFSPLKNVKSLANVHVYAGAIMFLLQTGTIQYQSDSA
jgi:hypothetical protein